jgi:hypothetical protein
MTLCMHQFGQWYIQITVIEDDNYNNICWWQTITRTVRIMNGDEAQMNTAASAARSGVTYVSLSRSGNAPSSHSGNDVHEVAQSDNSSNVQPSISALNEIQLTQPSLS